MSVLSWLTHKQMERLRPFFPKSHGHPRVDDRRVLSGMMFSRLKEKWRIATRYHRRPTVLFSAGHLSRCNRDLLAMNSEPGFWLRVL